MVTTTLVRPFMPELEQTWPDRQKLAGQVSGSEIPDAREAKRGVVDAILDGVV